MRKAHLSVYGETLSGFKAFFSVHRALSSVYGEYLNVYGALFSV